MQRNDSYAKIPLNKEMSVKMNDKFCEKIYDVQVATLGQPLSHHLILTDDIYKFKSNIVKPNIDSEVKDIKNQSYTFVIISDAKGNPVLRIQNGGHYFLSGKADFVYAAGDITFKDGKITEINDQSGAYHLNGEQMTDAQKDNYYISLKKVYEAVGLDFAKFKSFGKANKKPSCCSNLFNLFTPKKIAVAATVGMVGVICAVQATM